MDLPLPKVVPDTQAGGGLVTSLSGVNALNHQMLQNKLLGVQTQYYPLTTALQAMSNPLMWAFLSKNPQAQNAITQMMGGAMGQATGGNQGGGGLLSTITNKLGSIFGGTPSSPQQQSGGGNALQAGGTDTSGSSGGGNPMLPSQGGMMGGVFGKETAPFTQSPYPGGALIPDAQGGAISVPTGGTVDTAQTAISAINRVQPMLDAVIKDAPKYLGAGEKGKIKVASFVNNLKQYGGNLGGLPDATLNALNIDPDDVSGYNNWNSNIVNSAESVMKGMALPQNADSFHQIQTILTPTEGETGKGYAKRIQSQLDQLQQQKAQQERNINYGFQVGDKSSPTQATSGASDQGAVPYVTITNKKTGETQRMSLPEARRRGIKGA